MSVAFYDKVTDGRRRFVRVDELCRLAVEKGVLPDPKEDAALPLKRKKGLERAQGAFLGEILGDYAAGMHLCHGMLLPAVTDSQVKEFQEKGEFTAPGASLRREGKAAVITMTNPPYLNAEDEGTLPGFEAAVDLALMDPQTEVCVLRGAAVTHPKYAGRRLFGAGINLTHLYEGKIRFLWYLIRDLGLVNKFYRGLALPEVSPEIDSREKLWIAAVDGFAIGGHCQILLTMDYTIAAADAYLTLPARKEGIIPGAANLRLPRFVGDRIARQAILAERRLECDSAAGRLVCDDVVPPARMDWEIGAIVDKLTSSGVVSAAGNRRAFRIAQEPLDTFRRYMAVYAREQVQCHLSPALVANLERNWKVK
jgi:thioesterase DpgC